MQRGVPDPYRELGIQRAATDAQIKAAHRKLAKRHHPDAQGGDTIRFLSIQEAYALLSDPLRRREWDARHAPGPVRAGDAVRRGQKPRASDGHWTREEGTPGGARQRGTPPGGARRPAANRPAGESGSADPRGGQEPHGVNDAHGAHGVNGVRDRQENRADPDWNPSGRDPSARTYRWSAENVPWWEDFSPRGAADRAAAADAKASGHRPPAGSQARTPRQTPGGAGAGATSAGTVNADSAASPSAAGHPDAGSKPDHGDVYSRSSGAAWSSAARRYFRKGDDDLASRGAFVYRGTQVVTGAKAREASDELLKKRPGVRASPRQAFEPRPADGPPRRPEPGSPPSRPTGPTGTQSRSQAPRSPLAEEPQDSPDLDWAPGDRRGPSLAGAASVGAVASSVVTLPLLVLGSFVLNPPLQPTFAAILLLLAAITGAVAAAVWVRLRPDV